MTTSPGLLYSSFLFCEHDVICSFLSLFPESSVSYPIKSLITTKHSPIVFLMMYFMSFKSNWYCSPHHRLSFVISYWTFSSQNTPDTTENPSTSTRTSNEPPVRIIFQKNISCTCWTIITDMQKVRVMRQRHLVFTRTWCLMLARELQKTHLNM